MSSLLDRFESFVRTIDGFECIDALLKGANLPPGQKRADYLLQNRQIIVEQKVLEVDPKGRPQKFVDKLGRERGWVIFGTVSTRQVFEKEKDADDLQRRMVLDLAKTIDADVANADKQTAQTRSLFNIPDAMGILVLLNQGANTLKSDVMHYALANVFEKKKQTTDDLRYPANDGVVVISEAQTVRVPGFLGGFPTQVFYSPQTTKRAAVEAFGDSLLNQWAAFNNAPMLKVRSALR
jgi:hypothetical protein